MPLACVYWDLNCTLLFKILRLWKIFYLFALARKDHISVGAREVGWGGDESIKEIKVKSGIPGKLIQFGLIFHGGENM